MNVANHSAGEPRAVVGIKVDTLGDLILFAPALGALRTAWPGSRIVVLIRAAYADIAPLLAPGVDWLTTTLDPFVRGPADDPVELSRVRAAIADHRPEVFVAATSRRNWLETLLAAESGAERRIALGTEQTDEFFATQLRVGVGVDGATAFTDRLAVELAEPDWQRNFRIADALLGRSVPRAIPSVQVPAAARSIAEPFLKRHGLVARNYVVCAAAGFANVAIKTWPAEQFAAVLRHLCERHGLRIVLIGSESEKPHLDVVAGAIGGEVVVWVGRQGSLPELAALIADAAIFVGNDTGTMHLASALDVPTVAVFGGGTWPRFKPAGRRVVSIVHPLPCFGCGWDCAFGDAPCVKSVTIEDAIAAADFVFANRDASFNEVREVAHIGDDTKAMMGKAAASYRTARTDHLARQHKLEELTALDREKDKEIDALKATCDEREKMIVSVHNAAALVRDRLTVVESDKVLLEKVIREMPADAAKATRGLIDQAVHIRNIEALLRMREHELAEMKATHVNRTAGLHDLEQAKHYGRMLAEKEQVIQTLRRGCDEREAIIRQLSAEATTLTAKARKLWMLLAGFAREKLWRPLDIWLFNLTVERYWMQIGVLRHYDPRPLKWDDRIPGPKLADAKLPQVGIVTPSYGQERFIERTMRSILDQHYPRLRYVVQDGGSKDRSPEIIARYADRLHHWETVRDNGQADAIGRGFKHIVGALEANDVMAWLNSDDLLGPGVLRFVAEYFARHPNVDAIYGHRIIIDDDDRDVGRWIMPRHNADTLEWIDYVPQETLFWRKRAWELVGGIDPTYQFALDWDFLARLQLAGCRIVRVPYFLGAFRVHAEQKTSQAIHTTGAGEMCRIRTRFHGERHDNGEMIERHARHARFWGAVTARLHEVGIRW